MKNYNKYIFIKFFYDFILTTILFLIICFLIYKYNFLNLNYYFNTKIYIILEVIYAIIVIFRVVSGYDNIIPRLLTIRDKFLGKIDSKNIEKDYKKNKKIYNNKLINIPHIKELNASKCYWINRLLVEFNEDKEHYKNKVEDLNKQIKIINKKIKNYNDEIIKINIALKKENNATQKYYLTNRKEELEKEINKINLINQENIKEKNVLILEYKNRYVLLEKQKNMISRDFEIRYKNYIKSTFKNINRNGYIYKIESLEDINLVFKKLEED